MKRRKLFKKLKEHLDKKEFTILTGARQTGKSTLLKQLMAEVEAAGRQTVFLNLENKTVLADLDEHPFNLLKYLPKGENRIIVFLDEVQYLTDPSNFLKLLYDEHVHQLKIVASGSSVFYIDDKFRDSLAGRKKLFQLFTCSFDEYLMLTENEDLLQELIRMEEDPEARSSKLDYLRNEWELYVLYGGYPAVILEPDRGEKVNKLKEIRDSFIKRDILESGVENETAFYNLFRILAGQSGSLVNQQELATTLRIKNTTVDRYLTILQKCFHLTLVRPFHQNLRKELVKMPKAYLMDTGLRNCLINNFESPENRPDKGELWESMVFRILTDHYGPDEIRFWRTADGNEIDFILPYTDSPKAIEVKYDKLQVRPGKYTLFTKAYPEIPLVFCWHSPFETTFFSRLRNL